MSGTRFDTLTLHAGAAPDPATGARATPIHLTTSFVFRDSEHAASLFNMERAGHVYSRISNPTVAVFEERVAGTLSELAARYAEGPPRGECVLLVEGAVQGGVPLAYASRSNHFHFASSQLSPIPASTSNGTFSFMALLMTSRANSAQALASFSGASNTSSSWTCSSIR